MSFSDIGTTNASTIRPAQRTSVVGDSQANNRRGSAVTGSTIVNAFPTIGGENDAAANELSECLRKFQVK